jgi:peptidoglycan/LPS O-acetylase OafA/YrhL
MSKRYFGLDVLRSLAVLGVLLLHSIQCTANVPEVVKAVCERGWAGVDLFFVLSGFLIGSQVVGLPAEASVRNEVRNFWIKRWSRTLPLYFTVLAVYVFIKPTIFHAPFVGHAWMYCIFIQNFFPIRDFAQSWSLCIEEQFYLVLPLLMVFFRPKKGRAFLIPAVVSVATRALIVIVHAVGGFSALTLPEHDTLFRFNTLAHLDGLSIGLFLAATKGTWTRFAQSTRTMIAFGGVALLTASLAAFSYQPNGIPQICMFLFLSIGFGATLVGVHAMGRVRAIGLLVDKMALWSYGAYLWNMLLERQLVHHPITAPWWLGMFAFVGGSFALASVTYYAVEKPGLRLRAGVKSLKAD